MELGIVGLRKENPVFELSMVVNDNVELKNVLNFVYTISTECDFVTLSRNDNCQTFNSLHEMCHSLWSGLLDEVVF